MDKKEALENARLSLMELDKLYCDKREVLILLLKEYNQSVKKLKHCAVGLGITTITAKEIKLWNQ